MIENQDELELIDVLNTIWNRKWQIIVPTLLLVILTIVISFLLPKKWEVDGILQPGKFFIQTGVGRFEEVLVIDPNQIAGQINQETYNRLIATELGLNIQDFPDIRANHLNNTNLVHVSVIENDVDKGNRILNLLFDHIKKDFDKKIAIEIKGIETEISTENNQIKQKNLVIKDNLNEIKLRQIEKRQTQQEISSIKNKIEISNVRIESIIEEMKSVKKRIESIENQQKDVLKKEGGEEHAISLLLYSNEIQQNFQYYSTLDETLSNEKIRLENLDFTIKNKSEEIKKLDTRIDKLKIGIDKVNNEIEDIKNEIALLEEKKGRIDYTQIIKEPTVSTNPVFPKKRVIIAIVGILSLIGFTILAFMMDYVKKHERER